MTEDEARTKWCPMGFKPFHLMTEAGAISMASVNPHPTSDKPSLCIASDCMMWREEEPKKYGIPRDGKISLPAGYCGLGGKP